ncbi:MULTISPECIES: rhomboid family intramembrane serine protease [Thermomonosporaceae]|uniref:rhomboid family intramembrane serine protease n=1 Tax=Thermomonosporaceae TaxID=2012 RepID=UPI00255AD708|nr:MULTISPECIES: rhomboid family intramembrane serine protease [Thermomonosporaceae]MDL4773513.1 rhomboid family intramembrane serine protease [Actinomadura xylanilytica]
MSTESSPAPETSVPTCYRHPGRETYVRCTRCDRYICPECMRDAAVGHQCVDCVAEGHRSVRRPSAPLGARRGGAAAVPVVTYTLIGLCVLAYLAEMASSAVVRDFMMVGQGVDAGGRIVGVAEGQWYRLFTSLFLHQQNGGLGITHILFNMWALWAVGPALEQALGRWRFLTLYLLSGLGGSVLLYLVEPNGAAVGASGAIFGLFGAFFVIGRRMGGPVGPIVVLLVINLVITFSVPGISWQGHVGGLATGALLGVAFAYAPAASRHIVHIAAPVAVLVVFAALVMVKTADLHAAMGALGGLPGAAEPGVAEQASGALSGPSGQD